jgi:hypothetical protein
MVARALGTRGERRGNDSGGLPSWVGCDRALALRRVRAEGRDMETSAGWHSNEEATSTTAEEAAKCVGARRRLQRLGVSTARRSGCDSSVFWWWWSWWCYRNAVPGVCS